MNVSRILALGAAGLALAFTGATASAEGMLPRSGIRGEPVPGVSSWTGFYVGATVGGGWGESRFNDGATSNPFDIDGVVAGGVIGYNWQLSKNLVVGLEADLSYSGISGSFGPGNLGQPNGQGWNCGSGACVTDVNWFGTVRGRLGYAVGSLLVYGTGGLAYGEVESQIENASDWRTSSVNVGWTAGGGIEYAFAPKWTVKAEYLHVDLGWTDRAAGSHLKGDAEFDVVRAGLNYRFGN